MTLPSYVSTGPDEVTGIYQHKMTPVVSSEVEKYYNVVFKNNIEFQIIEIIFDGDVG